MLQGGGVVDLETAINIAWDIRDGVLHRQEPRPTVEEALQLLNDHRPGFNWLTGAACRKVLREHLGEAPNDGWN
jgi:hypothetical protein